MLIIRVYVNDEEIDQIHIQRGEAADNKTLMRLAQDEGISFSVAKIIYDKAWREAEAFFKALAPSPAPLPEVEEAMEEVESAFDYAATYDRWTEAGDRERYRKILATLRAALTEARQPKVVSGERAATFRQRAENSRNPK